MKKFIAAALLSIAFVSTTPAIAATPATPTEILTQAQTMLATDPAGAAALFEQAAAAAAALPTGQGEGAASIIEAFTAWASDPANQAANPTVAGSVFMSALTLSGTTPVTTVKPNLYASVLAAAQKFTNQGPKDNKKLAELEGFLQLAVSPGTPNTNGVRNTPPTDD